MKISVLYYSRTGTTKRMANAIVSGIETVGGIDAKAMSIENADKDFIKDSSCVIIGTPTYYTSLAGEVKAWLDSQSGDLNLSGKLGGAFATAAFVHGGSEIAIQSILTHLMFCGMLVYSGGGACGDPPIHMGPVALSDNPESYSSVFETYGKRMAAKAKEIFE